jgi:hypothetical protein
MSEHVTLVECLLNKAEYLGRLHGDEPFFDEGKLTNALLIRAATAIADLQAQIDTKPEPPPPSSPDTDEARDRCRVWEKAIRRPYSSDESDEQAFVRTIRTMADALDAARAELLAMSRFQCPQPDVAVCEKRWQADHQLACLQHVDETCGTALAEEFGIWGCDIIEHVANALAAARQTRPGLSI